MDVSACSFCVYLLRSLAIWIDKKVAAFHCANIEGSARVRARARPRTRVKEIEREQKTSQKPKMVRLA